VRLRRVHRPHGDSPGRGTKNAEQDHVDSVNTCGTCSEPRPPHRVVGSSGFADEHGPTVLLVAGAVLIGAGIAAVFANHLWVAPGMWMSGLIAIAVAAMLRRMTGPIVMPGLSATLLPIDTEETPDIEQLSGHGERTLPPGPDAPSSTARA
jgi:hypothetical protein